jgi:hypothetical protein
VLALPTHDRPLPAHVDPSRIQSLKWTSHLRRPPWSNKSEAETVCAGNAFFVFEHNNSVLFCLKQIQVDSRMGTALNYFAVDFSAVPTGTVLSLAAVGVYSTFRRFSFGVPHPRVGWRGGPLVFQYILSHHSCCVHPLPRGRNRQQKRQVKQRRNRRLTCLSIHMCVGGF